MRVRNRYVVGVVAVLTAVGLFGLVKGLAAYFSWMAGPED